MSFISLSHHTIANQKIKTNSLAEFKRKAFLKKTDQTLVGKWESREEMTGKSEPIAESGLIQEVKNVKTRPVSNGALEIIFTENSKHYHLLL